MYSNAKKLIKITALLLLLFPAILMNAQGKKNKKAKEEVKVEESLTWQTDLLKANEISQKTKKPIFAMFTGSDWCIWCKKLQADVFSKADFISWANKNVVLLEVDFPRFKQLPAEQMQQNQSLQQTFGVMGYPTCWIFNMTQDKATGKYNIVPVGSLGYPQGAEPGKEELKFLDDAGNIMKKNQPAK